jgi:HD-like signal output (HDOD) protein
MSREAAEIVRGAVSLHSLPEVYQRLTRVIDHPRSCVADIAQVVSQDPGLTARLLGLVNSSFLGFPGRIESVSQAVSVVGTAQLQDLALATSVLRVFEGVPQELVDMDSFWRHALASGLLARLLAARRRDPNLERFFVAGLLHDVGSLVLYVQRPNQSRRCLRHAAGGEVPLHEAEAKVLGCDHAEVGRALLAAWHLPLALQDAVGSHHAPSVAFCFPGEAAVVHVADLMADALELGSNGERLVPPLDPEAWARLGIAISEIPAIVAEALHQLDEVAGVLLRRAA